MHCQRALVPVKVYHFLTILIICLTVGGCSLRTFRLGLFPTTNSFSWDLPMGTTHPHLLLVLNQHRLLLPKILSLQPLPRTTDPNLAPPVAHHISGIIPDL